MSGLTTLLLLNKLPYSKVIKTRMNPAGALTEVSLASQYRSSGIWPDRLITDDLDEYAKSRSGHVVVIDSRQSMTYAQLQDSSYRVAAGLLSLGVKPNDRVAIQLPNWSE